MMAEYTDAQKVEYLEGLIEELVDRIESLQHESLTRSEDEVRNMIFDLLLGIEAPDGMRGALTLVDGGITIVRSGELIDIGTI
jgi:hypothetical protein